MPMNPIRIFSFAPKTGLTVGAPDACQPIEAPVATAAVFLIKSRLEVSIVIFEYLTLYNNWAPPRLHMILADATAQVNQKEPEREKRLTLPR